MSRNSFNSSYLSPAYPYQLRPPRTRSSSASFTDTMSHDMHRHPSQSSYIAASSQTASSIHSNIGDSIASLANAPPLYIQREPETYLWSRAQIGLQPDRDAFPATDHPLLSPESPLPRPPSDVNDPLQSIEAHVDDPGALFESVINTIRDRFARNPDPTTYALNLARSHLTGNELRSLMSLRVAPPTPAQPAIASMAASPIPSHPPQTPLGPLLPVSSVRRANGAGQRFMCKLCSAPTQIITSRGAFKRHVANKHIAKSSFLCGYCDWSGTRKDKLRDHLRTRHHGEYNQAQDLNECQIALNIPSGCNLCETDAWMNHIAPFRSWDAWFDGIAAHCRIDEDSMDDLHREQNHPQDQGGGNAGGSSGSFFSGQTFMPGSSAGGAFFPQQGNLPSGSMFTGWTFKSSVKPEYDEDGNEDQKSISLKILPYKGTFDLSDISKELHAISFNACSSPTKISSSQIDSPDGAHPWVQRQISLISSIIDQRDTETLVISIHCISLRLSEKLRDDKSVNNRGFAADPLILGEKTLYNIHADHSMSHQILARHLRRCHNSLDAIQWELSSILDTTAEKRTTVKQSHRHKRLSSLWIRLRAVTLVLSLQKEVAINEEHVLPSSPHASNIENQLVVSKTESSKCTVSSWKTDALESIYNLAQKYLLRIDLNDDPYQKYTKNSPMSIHSRSPCVDTSSGLLRCLTSVISNPTQSSLTESYDTTDLYRLVHRSMTNISARSF